LALAVLVGVAGCGGAESEVTTTAAGARATWAAPATTATTAAGMASTTVYYGGDEAAPGQPAYDASAGSSGDGALGGPLTAAAAASGQKIISDVQIEIQVEAGKFETVFDQAIMLAGRYGGYLVSSNAYASGEDSTMKSGTVAIRVPSTSFTQAMTDATKLGTLKNETLSTQDVTEEYVDLQARIKNSQAHVDALVTLLGQAKTIDEILRVQSVLTEAQQELEQLEGRMRFLDEHTSYSTITMTIYEKGTEPVVASTGWGVGTAFKDALHYLVRVFNGLIRGLGVLIPVLIVLAIIGFIVYRIVIAATRRSKQRQQMVYQVRPEEQGWRYPAPGGPVTPMHPQGPGAGVTPAGAPAAPVASVSAPAPTAGGSTEKPSNEAEKPQER
jgi:hypothetical protein